MIDISTLPSRSHTLSDDAMAGVLGGCKHKGEGCKQHKDCCDDLRCQVDPLKVWEGGSCGLGLHV